MVLLKGIRKLILIALNKGTKREQLNMFKKLESEQKDSIEVIEKRQLSKLNEVIQYSYENVPYYRELFEEQGLVENGKIELSSFEEFAQINCLTKQIIRSENERLYARGFENRAAYKNTSGGSTGEPIIVLQDQHYTNHSLINFWLVTGWRRLKFYHDTFFLWGATRDDDRSIKTRISRFLHNVTFVSTAKLTDADKVAIFKKLAQKKPSMIIAYAQSIYDLALFAEENNIQVVPQKVIHSGAGMLYDFMRAKIEKVFGCKVFNHYGSREVSSIASECTAHDGLHILADFNYVEIVNEQGALCKDGEIGEVVVTTLTNFSMPLIRFKIGDLARKMPFSECSCGVNYPKLADVKGRTSENFKTDKGETISGEYLTLQFNFVQGVKSFQIIQLGYTDIQIKLIVDDSYNKRAAEVLTKEKFQELFGENLNLDIQYVNEIEKTPTGKHLFTINKM